MMKYQVQIIRSRRKTISLEIKEDGLVVVRGPQSLKQSDVNRILEEKSGWIEKHLARAQQTKQQDGNLRRFTPKEIQMLYDQAAKHIPERVAYYAEQIGVTYGRITIRNQKTRWGSCSAKGNLNFNCLLMLTPPDVLDYVVVHELCHRKEMNHSKAFWTEVEKILPDYKVKKQWLKNHGGSLISRL